MENTTKDSDKCDDEELKLEEKTTSNEGHVKEQVLKQSTLCFSKVPLTSSSCQLKSVLETTTVDYNPNGKKWIDKLLPYFEIVNVSTLNGQARYTMRCLVCNQSGKGNQKDLTDKCASSFARHLKRHHTDEYEVYQKPKESRDVVPIQQQTITSVLKVEPYNRSDPRQKRFEKDLLHFVLKDTTPFSVVEGVGFRNLIHGLDKRLIIPRRFTIERWVTKEFAKVKADIKKALIGMPVGTLHFIIDIWTSQQGNSIMGVKVQFIDQWKINQLVVGFKHFPDSHTAENIRDLMNNFLGNEMGLNPKQIGTITADNAANMIGAFKTDVIQTSTALKPTSRVSSMETDSDEHLDCIEQEPVTLEETLNVLDIKENLETTELAVTALNLYANGTLKRNACLAHLLQLAVKDAIARCSFMVTISRKINDIVTFFHNSPKWTAKLKARSNDLSLIKPVVTRWNSLYLSLQRILRNDAQVNMPNAVNETLAQARAELTKRCKVPAQLYEEELEAATLALDLLEPCTILTDKFQSDGVTSSIVQLSVIKCVRDITDVTIDPELQEYTDLCTFKENLSQSIKRRFASQSVVEEDRRSRGKKIVSVDVFQDESYTIATLLDPRIKTTCFEEFLTRETVLKGCVQSKEAAIKVLKKNFSKEKQSDVFPRTEAQIGAGVSREPADIQVGPPVKKRKSIFAIVSELAESSSEKRVSLNEIDDYLSSPLVPGDDLDNNCPLTYWKKHEPTLPVLATMARRYHGMPASSGAIERLFSVAAGLGKARNARLLPETTESILCCNCYYTVKKF